MQPIVHLVYSMPGRPEGRGRIERFFRTVREQFLVEITGATGEHGRHHVTNPTELNRLFTARVETQHTAKPETPAPPPKPTGHRLLLPATMRPSPA